MNYTELEKMILNGFKAILKNKHMPKEPNYAAPKRKDFPDWETWHEANQLHKNLQHGEDEAADNIELAFLIQGIQDKLGTHEAEIIATIRLLEAEGLLEPENGFTDRHVITREGLLACRSFKTGPQP